MATLVLSRDAETALRRYRVFYRELFQIKRLLQTGNFAALVGDAAASGMLSGSVGEQTLQAARQRLRTAILVDEGLGEGAGAGLAAGRRAGISPGYVCAAVADAALLHDIDWPGRSGWAETPLEVLLYRSRIAGDRIFDAVDDLVARHREDAEATALTILLALETGYRGRYRDSDDRGEIERLKARLYEFVFRIPPTAAFPLKGLAVGAEEALVNARPVSLPALRPWLMAVVGLTLVYLFVSLALWHDGVASLVSDAARAVDLLHQVVP